MLDLDQAKKFQHFLNLKHLINSMKSQRESECNVNGF